MDLERGRLGFPGNRIKHFSNRSICLLGLIRRIQGHQHFGDQRTIIGSKGPAVDQPISDRGEIRGR